MYIYIRAAARVSRKVEIFSDVDPRLHNAAPHAKSPSGVARARRLSRTRNPRRETLRGFPHSLRCARNRSGTSRIAQLFRCRVRNGIFRRFPSNEILKNKRFPCHIKSNFVGATEFSVSWEEQGLNDELGCGNKKKFL